MVRRLAVTLFAFMAVSAAAQSWQTVSSTILYTANNIQVGISTSSPAGSSALDVRGVMAISNHGAAYWTLDRDDTDGSLVVADVGTERMRFTPAGFIGVGTTSPTSRLHIQSTAVDTIPFTVKGTNGLNRFELRDDDATVDRMVLKLIDANSSEQVRLTAGGTDAKSFINSGNFGVGTQNPSYKLHVVGNAHVQGTLTGTSIEATYQDVAEWVPATQDLAPGTVVVLNPNGINEVMMSSAPYDSTVAGVVSEQPGLLLGKAGANKEQIATTGRVKVRVDASRLPIRVGDLLVTADKPGMAKRSEPVEINGIAFHRPGTIIGKALEPLAGGEGEILVLLSMQ